MRTGLLAFGTKTGLGYQTLGLYKNLHFDKTMLCDLSKPKKMPFFRDWYGSGPEVSCVEIPTDREVDEFLDGLDLVFVCETPLNYRLFEQARKRGIRTILQYNYEFLDYFSERNLPRPSVFASPSQWHIENLHCFQHVRPLPVPVIAEDFPAREITEAKTFIHIAGQITAHDRNGTIDFLEAVRAARGNVPSDVRFVVYAQTLTQEIRKAMQGAGVELIKEVPEPSDLYTRGDVLIMPRRYGGMSIPVQEALVTGMPVVMPKIDPNYRWLPDEWLVPAVRRRNFRAKTMINVYGVKVTDLSQVMIRLARDPDLVADWAARARKLGESLTWSSLRPVYDEFFDWTMTLRP